MPREPSSSQKRIVPRLPDHFGFAYLKGGRSERQCGQSTAAMRTGSAQKWEVPHGASRHNHPHGLPRSKYIKIGHRREGQTIPRSIQPSSRPLKPLPEKLEWTRYCRQPPRHRESSSQLCWKAVAMGVRRFELPKLPLDSVLSMTSAMDQKLT